MEKLHVLWFVSDLHMTGAELSSRLGSVRLRCLAIVRALEQSNPSVKFSVVPLTSPLQLDTQVLDSADIAVIGKVFGDWSALLRLFRERGTPVLLDICDDVIASPQHNAIYAGLLAGADALVAASSAIAASLATVSRLSIETIPDPLSSVQTAPTYNPAGALKLCWFGQPGGLKALQDFIHSPSRLSAETMSLDVVTSPAPEVLHWISEMNAIADRRVEITHIEWSEENEAEAIARSDAIIIPVADDQFSQGKTANRLMSGISAGKPCVATPLDSYVEFTDFTFLADDLWEALRELQVMPATDVAARIAAGQVYVEENFSAAGIASLWLATIRGVVLEHQSTKGNPPIKLNVGCGDKLLPGYTNVDLVDERAQKKPDVVCDIRELSVFDDDFADEILAVHVVEHFYHWEAQPLLKEWMRVLKPGGELVIEVPDLMEACRQVLANPDTATRPGAEGQRSMWVLYGDPAWKDPLMCHKWLYSEGSLSELLREAGLVNVRREPAQFKLREPRDMRVVGEKPTN